MTVSISSDHPDAFAITPDNWNQPQEVQVRLAFTIQNYISGTASGIIGAVQMACGGGAESLIIYFGAVLAMMIAMAVLSLAAILFVLRVEAR
ncbi:MAG: hypothetical protein TE42_03740 [Candidatus Synechococcus spongiarum SP3]|uniref:Uncharacterized protein n=1 Tax=Candidatus Synechococcus spongiarum SP3 TaxID=1604020 RepID=A0A0G2HLQ3_9SYNE|nr:MAG: hypothetical protein TE42_03740 [Candidatus Synechococcus spongiarum SP3]